MSESGLEPRPPNDLTCHTHPIDCLPMAELFPEPLQTADTEWITFPGGELAGKRPKVLCPTCREANRSSPSGPKLICFQCYRAELQRDRALKAAGELDTGSNARFQFALPFDPVNKIRLAALKAERAADRQPRGGPGGTYASPEPHSKAQAQVRRCVERRRRAQIAARHALRALSLQALPQPARERTIGAVMHAAELQLPESWLPFVVSRQP
jgi:hypothetical protein